MVDLPMFPLENPVVPHTAIPLHIFEDRYRRMIRDLLDGDRKLGIVMIERGSEVGGGDTRSAVGTLARVADAEQLDDGRWIAVVVGLERIRVHHWIAEDPYPRAEIEPFPALPSAAGLAERKALESSVRRLAALLAELDEPGPPVTVELSDEPIAAAFQAIVASPIGPLDAQRLLEVPAGDDLIARVLETLAEKEELARMRLATGD
jgi:Lon protease-like protein